MKMAFVAPDGLSVILFCKTIIKTLQNIPQTDITIVCDFGKYQSQIESMGVRCVDLGAYRYFSIAQDTKYLWKLWRFFSKARFDVVFTFCTKQNIYGSIAAWLAGVSIVYSHVVGLGTAFLGHKEFKGRMMAAVTSRLYKFVGSIAKSVWFTNKNDLAFFCSHEFVDKSKAILTPNYLDVQDYRIENITKEEIEKARNLCDVKANERIVVMVARLIWAKGIREYSEAAMKLHRSHPNLKFILVAPAESGSYGSVPLDYIRNVERSANLMWLGFQEHVKPLYAIAELAVLPTYYKEGGYPRALLEPMAMGKPVITTDSEDCRDAVEEGRNGFLIPIRDSAALADAIVRVMDNDPLREQFGRYSRIKAVRDFDESKIIPVALRGMGLPV